MKTSILTLKLIGLFFLITSNLKAQQECAPVAKLKKMYSEDAAFKSTVDEMFLNIQEVTNGPPNPWKNKDFDDLCAFINEWFYFLPNTENGLDRILKFSFLYYKNPAGKKFILEEPGLSWTHYFIEERGKYMDSPASAKIVADWLSNPNIKNDDFELPKNGFSSFNDFFTRDLKPGARSIDEANDNSVLVSPADGIINMIANDLQLDTEIPTKGKMAMSLNALLDNSKYAKNFIGGSAMAVFLMPDNYHHYHAPTSGLIIESKEEVGDRLFGMPNILDMINNGNVGYGKDYSVFENFKHGYFIIETDKYGLIAMIPIGLQTIGSVVFQEKFKNINNENAKKVYKGEKLGHFAYGGSTVLLLFEKGKLNSLSVQQGQRIGNLRE